MLNPNVWIKNWVSPQVFQSMLLLAGRALMAYLFIIAGWGKIAGYAGTLGYMESKGLPGGLLWLVILLELGGGLAILVGFQTRFVALFMIVFNILTAVIFHGGTGDETSFMKNIAIAGGFIYLMVQGAGAWSIDAWLERK
ncbi:DoxX family protein [Ignatzschineria larvae DSM 13226]|uniref:DoxX family protein n=1 Tax=Ignatzschineria larvae DSM 13226 TaxID=1111732 RepID=A0ABZ3BYI3_9GAMM|nr:DoxX family protein [Ignatzschineria larvae]